MRTNQDLHQKFKKILTKMKKKQMSFCRHYKMKPRMITNQDNRKRQVHELKRSSPSEKCGIREEGIGNEIFRNKIA